MLLIFSDFLSSSPLSMMERSRSCRTCAEVTPDSSFNDCECFEDDVFLRGGGGGGLGAGPVGNGGGIEPKNLLDVSANKTARGQMGCVVSRKNELTRTREDNNTPVSGRSVTMRCGLTRMRTKGPYTSFSGKSVAMRKKELNSMKENINSPKSGILRCSDKESVLVGCMKESPLCNHSVASYEDVCTNTPVSSGMNTSPLYNYPSLASRKYVCDNTPVSSRVRTLRDTSHLSSCSCQCNNDSHTYHGDRLILTCMCDVKNSYQQKMLNMEKRLEKLSHAL